MNKLYKPLKIALVENFKADFFKARLNLYKFLLNNGYSITAVFPKEEDELLEEKIEYFTYPFTRNTFNPFIILKDLYALYRHFKKMNYDIIHTFRFQPNLYINIIRFLLKETIVVNHVTGLGIAFTKKGIKGFISKFIYTLILQFNLIFSNRIIVQNNEDYRYLCRLILGRKKVRLILGSGVDTDIFDSNNVDESKIVELKKGIFRNNQLTFTIVTRLITQKGINELVEAFKSLYFEDKSLPVKLLIVGWFDEQNPNTVDKAALENLPENIVFLGRRDDVKELLALSDVFILPSYYREGVPRSILEALSMGKPIITTDMPGCKETVIKGGNGIIIKPQDFKQIINAVKYFHENKSIIEIYGKKSREIAVNKFSSKEINERILEVYKEIFK